MVERMRVFGVRTGRILEKLSRLEARPGRALVESPRLEDGTYCEENVVDEVT